MAYQTNYYISTTPPTSGWADAQNIDAVLGVTPLTGSRPPMAYWQPPKTVVRPDGTMAEVGLPAVLWKFGVLPLAQYTALRDLFTGPSARVYFRTRNAADDYTFADYTGIAYRPQDDSKRQPGDKFIGVELLIAHVEPYPTADTTAPVVTAFTATATPDELTLTITAFPATDANAVKVYLITESATSPTAADTYPQMWVSTPPTAYTFYSAGEKTLYAWAKDAAGNISAAEDVTITVTDGA